MPIGRYQRIRTLPKNGEYRHIRAGYDTIREIIQEREGMTHSKVPFLELAPARFISNREARPTVATIELTTVFMDKTRWITR